MRYRADTGRIGDGTHRPSLRGYRALKSGSGERAAFRPAGKDMESVADLCQPPWGNPESWCEVNRSIAYLVDRYGRKLAPVAEPARAIRARLALLAPLLGDLCRRNLPPLPRALLPGGQDLVQHRGPFDAPPERPAGAGSPAPEGLGCDLQVRGAAGMPARAAVAAVDLHLVSLSATGGHFGEIG